MIRRQNHRIHFLVGWIAIIMVSILMLPASLPAESLITVFDRLRNEITPLDLKRPPQCLPDALPYFQYYGIAFKNTAHHFGYFESAGYKVTVHVLMPEASKGTIYVLHGYLDHTGLLKNIMELLIGMRFTVATYDLPGHGLSSGKRMAINDFSEYAAVLNDFMRRFAPQLPEPQYLVGHSTGCAIAYEYLHQHTTHYFDRIIFLAPLVHSNHWWISKAGYRLTAPFVDKIRRAFKENTSDRKYLAFIAKDPLQSRSIPLSWVKALFTWEDRIHRYLRVDQPVCIIQGTEDTVVDWRYNISFLQTKFSSTRVRMIPGAKHQLINERKDLRLNAFNEIRDYIEEGKIPPQ